MSLILSRGWVMLELNPKMLVWVALSRHEGISRLLIIHLGIFLRADPELTWKQRTFIDPMYPVNYKGRSCLPLIGISLGQKEMQAMLEKIWRLSGPSHAWMSSTLVVNTSVTAKASGRAFRAFLGNLRIHTMWLWRGCCLDGREC